MMSSIIMLMTSRKELPKKLRKAYKNFHACVEHRSKQKWILMRKFLSPISKNKNLFLCWCVQFFFVYLCDVHDEFVKLIAFSFCDHDDDDDDDNGNFFLYSLLYWEWREKLNEIDFGKVLKLLNFFYSEKFNQEIAMRLEFCDGFLMRLLCLDLKW